ncbi:MAG: APC family permease [Promethearchaeota archaeon]
MKINYIQGDSEFHKNLNKFSCLMLGIGGLIGGGIFSIIGVISIFAGAYSYISYFITGIVALITVYSYQKLSFKWCSPGGEYICIKNSFSRSKLKILGPFIGLLLYFGYIATMALYAYTFSIYFILFFDLRYNYFLVAMIITLLFSIFILFNLKGVKESLRIQSALVIIYISIFLLFVILGMKFAMQTPKLMVKNVGLDNKSIIKINILGIILGSASILVSYEGFQLIAYETYEMKDINSGLKMMKWSIIVAMIIYCLVGFTTMAILGPFELLNKGVHDAEVSIAKAALNSMGTYGMFIIIICALLSTASALNATILGSSRLAFTMSKDKILPKKFSEINKNKVPYISIIITGVLSILLTLFNSGALALASLTGLIFSQIFFIINFTNFKARKETNSNAFLPIIGMILTGSFLIILFIYSFLNFEQEIYSLISFSIIEGVTLFFVLHINNKNKNNNIKL